MASAPSSDARPEGLGRLETRGSMAAGVVIVGVGLGTTILPSLLRTGDVAFSSLGDRVVIPSVVYAPFLASLLAIVVFGAYALRGARAAAPWWVAAASLPLVLATIYAGRVLSRFAVLDASEGNLPYRTAAVTAPHLLGAGAASSAALFATLVALWFTRLRAIRVESHVSTTRFDAGAAIVAVMFAAIAVYLDDPFRFDGNVNFDELAFARSVDTGLALSLALLAIGAPVLGAALRRFALLAPDEEKALRADAAIVVLGAVGFAGCLVLVAVSDSRIRLLGETATFQPFLGSRLWYGVFAIRVGLAFAAAGAPFLVVRPTGRGVRPSVMFATAILVVLFAGAAVVDHEAATREEHAFRKSIPAAR